MYLVSTGKKLAQSDEVLESVRKERADKRKTKKNNDAEKTATKERKKTEAAEKKEKAAAETAKKREDKKRPQQSAKPMPTNPSGTVLSP
jgi:hypothetical protein